MPEEKFWETFFKPKDILHRTGLSKKVQDAADFGSGYGTFTLLAAKIVSGTVYAIDIDEELVRSLHDKAEKAGLRNVKSLRRDISRKAPA